MTAIYMDGFEHYGMGVSGNANMLLNVWAETQSNGSLGVLETPAWGARTGTIALTAIDATGATSNRYALATPITSTFLSLGFSFATVPTDFQSQICCFRDASNVDLARLWCQADGSIVLTDSANTVLASSAIGLVSQTKTWYSFEMNLDQAGGTFTLRINDAFANMTPAIAASGLSFANPIGMFTFVGSLRQQLDWVDDIFIRDAFGTVNNGWLGVRYIATLNVSGSSPYDIQNPPAITTIINAVQVTYEAADALILATPAGDIIVTPSGDEIGVPLTISSAFIGPLGGITTDSSHNLASGPNYYNDMYEIDPDTMKDITPTTIVNGAVQLNTEMGTDVTRIVVLIAFGTGIPSTLSLPSWTFVLDGHRFYVLSLGPESDWGYDMITQEWCQLQDQGFPGLNFTHGVMWGLKIIGSDILYDYLYELDPTQPFSEGWREVKHMVTGGVPTRTRSVIGVANFTLTASVGLDSAEDLPITLAFSDDNGVTWSIEFDEPLTDMSTQSLIWNALGSFAAPGRVFRITDYSGPIRLDGADVVLTVGTGADSGQEMDGQPAH